MKMRTGISKCDKIFVKADLAVGNTQDICKMSLLNPQSQRLLTLKMVNRGKVRVASATRFFLNVRSMFEL